MAFDRSKFKAAKLEANKAVAAEAEGTLRQNVGGTKRGDYHKIEEGTNYFRVMPPHSDEDPSWQPKVVTWLEVLVDELDGDRNPTGKKERKGRPIFDSRIHGGTPKDIIDQYIFHVKKKVYEEEQDQDSAKKRLFPIFGYRDNKQTWHPGILPNSSFVCYATKNGIKSENLGRLEIYKADKDKVEELNIDEGSDDPILTDSFSDPDEGVELVIILQKNEKNKYERILKKREPSLKGLKGTDKLKALEEFEESQKVPDDVLETLSEMDSLKDMFKGAYKRSDYERALEGLQYLDQKHNFGVFELDEFLDIVEEIDGYYSEDAEVSDKKEEKDSKVSETTTTSEDENFGELAPSDIDEMTRKELKELISEKGLKIRVTSAITDEVLKEMVLEVLWPEEDELETEETKAEVLPEETEENLPIVNSSDKSKKSLKERLAEKRGQEGK